VVFFTAGDQALLGVICDVRRENRINMSDIPIGTDHIHSTSTSFNKWLHHQPHAVVKEAISPNLPSFIILEMQHLRNR
jgi:hypothetical protein